MNTKKTDRRVSIVKDVVRAVKSSEIFETARLEARDEDYIKQSMHRPLLSEVVKMYETYKGYKYDTAYDRAGRDLKWEGGRYASIPNFTFLGVHHLPDFVLDFDDLKIAIEVKRGSSGAHVREAIGQAVVYNANYDFTVYLFIDTSDDKKIHESLDGEKEKEMIESLWENHNIALEVI